MDSKVSTTNILILACFIASGAACGGGGGGGGGDSGAMAPEAQSPVAPAPGAQAPDATDSVIVDQATRNLAAEETLANSDIKATSSNGVLTLEGTVNDTDALLTAERAIRAIPGVSSVENNLTPLSCSTQAMP